MQPNAVNMEAIQEQLHARYPDIPWKVFEEADRALNWELYWGQLPDDYWTVAEPLEHYVWKSWEQACDDLSGWMADIQHDWWIFTDCDCLVDSDPDNDDYLWMSVDEDGEEYDPPVWIGGEYQSITAAEILLHKEVRQYV